MFRIARPFEKERFENSPYAKVKSDKRLLWHGSRCTNFGGILSQGLRIAPPEAPSTGYMFGKGIYLADTSSKSAGYTWSHSSDGNALLLLCEAELGDPMQKLVRAQYNAGETAKQGGMISTMGQGDTGPQKWIDASIAHPSLKGIKMVSWHPPSCWLTSGRRANNDDFAAGSQVGTGSNQYSGRGAVVQRVHCLRHCTGAASLPLPRQDVVHEFDLHLEVQLWGLLTCLQRGFSLVPWVYLYVRSRRFCVQYGLSSPSCEYHLRRLSASSSM